MFWYFFTNFMLLSITSFIGNRREEKNYLGNVMISLFFRSNRAILRLESFNKFSPFLMIYFLV